MPRWVVQALAIEGRLIDKDSAIAIEILKPDPPVNANGILRQTQVLCQNGLRQ
jgi:hypothetical protein